MYKLLCGDNLEELKKLEDCSVNVCVTSPPYYGLRDYGTAKWIGGDPNCKHFRVSKNSPLCTTGHRAIYETNVGVGDSIYKKVCPICGAVREDKQVGLEESPELYIDRLVEIFREVKRVLRDDGVCFINIGDSYAGGSGRYGGTDEMSEKQTSNKGSIGEGKASKWEHETIKQKDLIGIPWMLAFALRNDGWYLRQDIIWSKSNPMPESVMDRFTKSHEYIFMLTKNREYYFDHNNALEDAVSSDGKLNTTSANYFDSKYVDKAQESSVRQGMNKDRGNGTVTIRPNLPNLNEFQVFIRNVNINEVVECGVNRTTAEHWYRKDSGFSYPTIEDWNKCRDLFKDFDGFDDIDGGLTSVVYETDDINKNFNGKRNKRDVWNVAVNRFKGAHFATYPEELIYPCVMCGCPEGGTVLDPFNGSGTTGVVALKNNRNYIGIDLNEEYVSMADERLKNVTGVYKVKSENGADVYMKKESLF